MASAIPTAGAAKFCCPACGRTKEERSHRCLMARASAPTCLGARRRSKRRCARPGSSTDWRGRKMRTQPSFQPAVAHYLEALDQGRTWGVVIIAAGVSRNGVFYPDHVLRDAAPRFEGAKVYARP